jgi:hypothetical protein
MSVDLCALTALEIASISWSSAVSAAPGVGGSRHAADSPRAGIACDPEDLAIARPRGFPDRSGLVVIHPGAAAAARRWPAERFAAVAATLHHAGHDVVITGDRYERDLVRSVAELAGLPESAVLQALSACSSWSH